MSIYRKVVYLSTIKFTNKINSAFMHYFRDCTIKITCKLFCSVWSMYRSVALVRFEGYALSIL